MNTDKVSVVLAHGAWADGSSWAKVIGPLLAQGHSVAAAPLPEMEAAVCQQRW